VNCRELDRWLDDGGAPEHYLEAMAHARICARCSATLGGVDELERMLAGPSAAMPEGFTERLMARVATTPQVTIRIPVMELLPFFQTVPWWVRVAVEPASLLAILLASALLWRGEALFALASAGAIQFVAWIARGLSVPLPSPDPAVGAALIQPTVAAGIALAVIPLVVMGSHALYRWSAALVGPHARLRGR
jgi:hypothetical protein